jgi:predicted ferric reductase
MPSQYLSRRQIQTDHIADPVYGNRTGFSTLFPFSAGLKGVDQDMNYVYAHVLLLTLLIVVWITVGLRIAQRSITMLRHLSVLGNPERQTFWMVNQTTWWPLLKRYLTYAPLWKDRHNREICITSELVLGTLPSRGHFFIISMYVLSNIAYCLALPYDSPRNIVLVNLRGRTGMLAALNMIPTVLFALRNNPLISWLQTPYDTFNLFHRWLGRIVVVEALLHTVAWLAVTHNQGSWPAVRMGLVGGPHAGSYMAGMVACAAVTIISIQAWSPIRHAFYETFLNVHKAMALTFLCGVYVHLKWDNLPQVPWGITCFVLYGTEYAVRIFYIIYHNYSRKYGWTEVEVEALDADSTRVTFKLPRPWHPKPGAHVHAYIPQLAWLSSHPFSVAWNDVRPVTIGRSADMLPTSEKDDTDYDRKTELAGTVSLVVRSRGGFTKRLYDRANSMPDRKWRTRGALEGPYGGHDSLRSYGTLLLFAGGVGITHQVQYVKDLVEGYHNGTCAARKVVLIWSVPNTEALEWVRPWMDEILRLPGRKDILTIKLFITKPRTRQETQTKTGSISTYPGRCNPQTVIDQEIRDRVGAMAVTVCGPGAFGDAVRKAVRSRVQIGVIDFIEEAFSY